MHNDSVEIDGKIFISSKRASRKYGYTMDYIGQLARSGKILSKLFGRNRFIQEESLISYQNSLILNPAPKISNLPNINNEISDIRDDKNEAEVTESSVIIDEIKEPVATVETEQKLDETEEEILTTNEKSTEIFNFPITPVSVIQSEFLSKNIGVIVHEKFPTLTLIMIISIAFLWTTLMFTGARFSYSNQYADSRNSASVGSSISRDNLKEFANTMDENLFRTLDDIQGKIFTDINSFKNFLASLFADRVVVVQSNNNQNSPGAVPQQNSSTTVATQSVGIDAEELRRAIAEVLDERGVVTVEELTNNTIHPGVVAMPSTGNASQDELLRQKVANSFSDQVTVTLDPSRTTGVVQPIFKNAARSDDYMFVLVPVKE